MSRISNQRPPIYQRLHDVFGVEWDRGLVIAYGSTIYTKSGTLPGHLIAHEEVHLRQQAEYGSPDAWYEQYITDPAFRLKMEVEAYQAQYRHLVMFSPRPERREWIKKITKDLSGPMYGHLVTYETAEQLIKNDAS